MKHIKRYIKQHGVWQHHAVFSSSILIVKFPNNISFCYRIIHELT